MRTTYSSWGKSFCEHFGVCGGCKWQHVAYDYQLQFKRQQVEDNLTRIGKIPLPEILPTKGSTKQQYYRNKLEFSFSNKSWLTYEQLQTEQEFDCRNALGFHIPGMFDKGPRHKKVLVAGRYIQSAFDSR